MLRRRRRAETLDLPNIALDASHDASRRSWVASANKAGTDSPIQNLPFGIFREAGNGGPPRGGVAIGDHILDVSAVVPLLRERTSSRPSSGRADAAAAHVVVTERVDSFASWHFRVLLVAGHTRSVVSSVIFIRWPPPKCFFLSGLAALSTFSLRSSMQPMPVASSGPTRPCCQITNTCRSATMAGPLQSA